MNRRNKEGYLDLTAYGALSKIINEESRALKRKNKPIVYVASPYVGDAKHNTEQAKRYCRLAIRQGCIPIAPHLLYTQLLDDTDKEERELGLSFALGLLVKADELWVFGKHISNSMSREITKAKRRGMTIKYYDEQGVLI